MGTHQVQWVHSQDALVIVAHCAVQIIDPQCLSRLNVIEGNLVRLDVGFSTDLLVRNHEGSKQQSTMICDPSEDLECLRWPTKEVQGAIAQQHNEITLVLRWQAQPKWSIGRYLVQGEVLLILWHDGRQMFQSFRDCNGSLVMADPYHHA